MKLPGSAVLRTVAALVGVLTMIAACTPVVVVDETLPGPRFCTREYNPVCAWRGDRRETFANPCLADEAGYRVVRRGECRRDRYELRSCTLEYDPVCARRGDERQTFSNACQAEVAGYRVIRDGECRGQRIDDDEVFCTREYAPVCARRRGNVRTFSNGCEAEAADYAIISDGPC